MTWTIVCFEEENIVKVMSDYWLKNGYCVEPKKSVNNYKKIVARCIKPNVIYFYYFKARSMSHNIGKDYTNYLLGFSILMFILLF